MVMIRLVRLVENTEKISKGLYRNNFDNGDENFLK
jgi:hypothetical protein